MTPKSSTIQASLIAAHGENAFQINICRPIVPIINNQHQADEG